MHFQQSHNQGLCQLFFYCVLSPPRLSPHTWLCPRFSGVLKATHEASRGPLKGTVSAQKPLQGSETETRQLLGGTEENSVSPTRGPWFFTKRNKKWVSGHTRVITCTNPSSGWWNMLINLFGLLIFGLGLTKSSSFSFGLLVSYLFQLSNVIRPKSEGGLLPFDIDERFLSFLARKIFYYPFDVSNIFYHFQSNLLQIRRYLLLALKQKTSRLQNIEL